MSLILFTSEQSSLATLLSLSSSEPTQTDKNSPTICWLQHWYGPKEESWHTLNNILLQLCVCVWGGLSFSWCLDCSECSSKGHYWTSECLAFTNKETYCGGPSQAELGLMDPECTGLLLVMAESQTRGSYTPRLSWFRMQSIILV